MKPLYNFSAGPAALPEAVLRTVQQELLDWQGNGLSVMEMSHRSPAFEQIITEAEQECRELLAIPPHYKVLFLQGGAHMQFAMVPLNLLHNKTADYVDTGHWSRAAIREAMRYGQINTVASAQPYQDTTIPAEGSWQHSTQAAYLHYTTNETIGGVQFPFIPNTKVPLVADMSSDFMSQPIDISRFGLIYAGAQKNVGPAGVTLVIIREDLLDQATLATPTMLNYQTFANTASMYNTPPTFAIYVTGLVFKWLKKQGGLAVIAAINQEKAQILYKTIDESQGFYQGIVEPFYRSQMNVTFRLRNVMLEELFLTQANVQQLLYLKGHRVAGGLRASIYNAVPIEGVKVLANFMRDFMQRYG